ncbi:HNH endonuclease [Pyxidicoccus sp. 3LG]
MIRVSRGNEPAELAAARARELPRVRTIAAVRKPSSEDIGGEYRVVQEVLWKAQFSKCCFCETREQKKRNDVEHFRPKSRAARAPGCTEQHGYWWLAWTWENLLFSCRNCNQAPAKLDKFPLAPGSEPLVPEQLPPGRERPLLIDPAKESGIDHIHFVWTELGPAPTGRWMPRPRNGSLKGAWTIKVCQLDRPDLLDLYGHHVEAFVKPTLEGVRSAIRAGRKSAAQAEWERAVKILLNARQHYIGLSHDVMNHFIPPVVRAAHQLVLPVPPV